MIYVVEGRQRKRYGQYLMEMHRQRHKYFVGTRGWAELNNIFEIEVDQYDSPTATYVLLIDGGELIASIRIMPTHFGTLLGDKYAYRIFDKYKTNDNLPYDFGPNVWEMYRLLVHRRDWQHEGHPAVRFLMIGMYEYLLSKGADRLLAVSDLALLPMLPEEWTYGEIGSRESFAQSNGKQGLNALVEIPLRPDHVENTRKNRGFHLGKFGLIQDHLPEAPTRILPEQLYMINRWLLSGEYPVSDAKAIVEKAEQDDECYQSFNSLLQQSVRWGWQGSPSGPERQSCH